MKIAFIKKKFNYYGGAENYLDNILTSLADKGHELHLITTEWPKKKYLNIHLIKVRWKNHFFSLIEFNKKTKKIIDIIKPDCTISFERTTNQDIYRAGDGCHKQWLRIRGSFEGRLKRITFLINPLHLSILNIEKDIIRNTPIIIANSNLIKDQLVDVYKISEEKIIVLYNGVNLKRFTPDNRGVWKDKIRKKYNLNRESKIILFAGSDYKRKGLKRLLMSFSNIKRDAILMIVGKGNIDYYRTLAKKYRIENRVFFLGPKRDIEGYYASADVFVLPTLYDPFSNATLEAMASGLAVITTKNNGASEIIENGKEGFILYDLVDPNELSIKINIVLEKHEIMGCNARKKAENYDITKMSQKLLKIIESFPN